MFNCCQCPTAKMSDNTLVLSLPNAITPVVWMIDMANTGTFLMKVESTDNGLFVLQKISNDGKKTEDIAYYSSKKKAVKAMTMVTQTVNSKGSSGLGKAFSLLKSTLLILASVGVLMILMMLYFPSIERMIIGNPQQQINSQQPVQQAPAAMVEKNPDAFGVPMSADDFLSNKSPTGFPF